MVWMDCAPSTPPARCSTATCCLGIRGLLQSWNFPFCTVNAERLIVKGSIFSSKPWKPCRGSAFRKLFFPTKRTLHYELIIKKLKPNVLHAFLSTQTVHMKPAIFRTGFSKIQHLSEKEKWSNKGCILDASNKRGEQKLLGCRWQA